MSSSDSLPIPRKNVAYRVTFDVRKNDGTLITTWAGMDSEVSQDGGTFADCTNEATEIATTSGMGYLDLTSTEMNADCVAIKVTLTNTDALPTTLVLYPMEDVDIRANVVDIAGAAVSTSTAQLGVNAVNVGGTAQTGRDIGASVLLSAGTSTGQLDFASGVVKANLAQILGTAITETAGQIAAAFKKFFDIAAPAATMDHGVLVDTVTTTTTATNLTNAPTNGDLTAAMKLSVNAETDTALADYDAPTHAELTAELATADDATLAAIAALNNLSAAGAADAVWDEILSGHTGVGSTGEALNAAGAAGDPWTTALPGAYGAGSAGKIVGDNINATISSRANQTSVDDLPTNAELATSQASADDATLAAIAALNNLSAAAVNAEVDTALADYDAPTHAEMTSEFATADDATLAAIAALNDVSATEVENAVWDAATLGHGTAGSFGELVGNIATGTPPSAAAVADAVWDEVLSGHAGVGSTGEALTSAAAGGGLDAAGVRAAVGLASANLDTQLADLPTNSELATSQAAADDATLAAIAALNDFDPALDIVAHVTLVDTTTTLTNAPTGMSTLDATGVRAAVGLAIANLDTQLADLPTNAELATSQAAADDATLAAIAALNNLSTADVNAQMLDVLSVDTFAQLVAPPTGAVSLKDAILWAYMLGRNARTQTATDQTLRNAGDTADIATSSVADDGSQLTVGGWS